MSAQDAFGLQFFGIMIGVALIYVLPTITAFYRKHPNRWLILVINIVFGGTGIGWLGSFVWAFSAAHLSPNGSNGGESGLNLFVNDPKKMVVETSDGSESKVYTTASAASPPVLHSNTDVIAQLEKLDQLKRSGAINQMEFDSLKSKLVP